MWDDHISESTDSARLSHAELSIDVINFITISTCVYRLELFFSDVRSSVEMLRQTGQGKTCIQLQIETQPIHSAEPDQIDEPQLPS